jgi:hypothetical protein
MDENEDAGSSGEEDSKSEPAKRSRGGRPTRLTPDLQRALCESLARGLPIKVAAALAGVSPSSVQSWRQAGQHAEEKQERGERLKARESDCLELRRATDIAMARSVSEIHQKYCEAAFEMRTERKISKIETETESDGVRTKTTETTDETRRPNLSALHTLWWYRTNNVLETPDDGDVDGTIQVNFSETERRVAESINRVPRRTEDQTTLDELENDRAADASARAFRAPSPYDDYYEFEHWEARANANFLNAQWWEGDIHDCD